MMLPSMLSLPAAALRVAAGALRLLAHTSERVADALAGGSRQPGTDRPATAPVSPPVPAATATPQPASAPTDIPALASRTAREVIASLEQLTMADLAELHAYESRHRRRRTVLDAIDRAVAPPADAQDDGDEAVDDLGLRDEVVYTTQTPAR